MQTTLGDLIQKRMDEKGYKSLKEVTQDPALKGVNVRTIQRWIKEGRTPQGKFSFKIASFLGISEADLPLQKRKASGQEIPLGVPVTVQLLMKPSDARKVMVADDLPKLAFHVSELNRLFSGMVFTLEITLGGGGR